MRDALLVMTFALSWIFFQPNIVTSAALPITGSLAALCLLLALAVKLSRRVDDEINAYRLATAFLVLAACRRETGASCQEWYTYGHEETIQNSGLRPGA
jgi:uncharacterized SAM-binding protein YcdF (DUF218 family)